MNYPILALISLLITQSSALKCYTCSMSENDADTRCADDLESLGSSAITDCDKKYCTLTRIEYLDPRAKLASLSRNCMDKVPADGVTEDWTYRTYSRSCKTDLCNSGSGKSDNNSGTISFGDKSTLYVPGTGRSSSARVVSSLFSVCSLIFLLFLYTY